MNTSDDLPEQINSRPRLTIAHFLLWIAVSSAMLGYNRATSLRLRLDYPDLAATSTQDHLFGALHAIVESAAVAGAILILWRRRRFGKWKLEPGERLLLALGVVSFSESVAFLPYLILGPSGFSVVQYAIQLYVVAIVILIAALTHRKGRSWSVLFWLLTVEAFFSSSCTQSAGVPLIGFPCLNRSKGGR